MGKYSAIHEGVVKPFRYKKMSKGSYRFYLDDLLVGEMVKIGKVWSCFGYLPKRAPLVGGFANRYYCAEYLLVTQGIWRN